MAVDPTLVIYLCRHGETEFNRQNRFCGQTDSPLTAKGIEEAHRNGRILRQRIEDRGALRLVSSPLARALETAGIMRAELGQSALPIETDARLREIAFGAWEGLTVAEIKDRYPDAWQRRLSNRWTHAPPGGESYEMLARRVGAWLKEAQGVLLVVTHGAVDRVLRGLYGRLSEEAICTLPEPQDEVFQLKGGRIATL